MRLCLRRWVINVAKQQTDERTTMEAAMSDPSAGARAPDNTPLADVPVTETYPATTYPETTYPATETYTGRPGLLGREVRGGQAGRRAERPGRRSGRVEVKDTAKEQAQRVGAEAKTQARNVAVRRPRQGRATRPGRRTTSSSAASAQTADHLDEMRGDRGDSPAAAVVSRVADGGRQIADYLDRNGPEGVLREVQDFARRRPGAFLATALAAGFVVGRLGKGVAKADAGRRQAEAAPATPSSRRATHRTRLHRRDAGYADPADPATPPPYGTTGYPAASTEYASTGTGTPRGGRGGATSSRHRGRSGRQR